MAGCFMVSFFTRWTVLFCLILVLKAGFSVAQSFNVTVDDHKGPSVADRGVIEYSPEGWTESGFGIDRGVTEVDFANARGFEGTVNWTWHKAARNVSSNHRSSATLRFRGTAVYVQCVLSDGSVEGPANSDMYFTVDGGPEANFTQPALTSKPGRIFEVFQQTNLTPGDHTITIYNGPRDGKPAFDSIVMFLDAIVYTTNDKSLKIPVPSPSGQPFTSDAEAATTSAPITHTTSDVAPPTRSNANQSNSSSLSSQQIGIIVGGVCGGLVGLIATFLLFWLWRRRFQDSNYSPTAFDPRRFVRWPGSRPKAPSAQYSSDMEAMRPSQPSVNSLYMYPSPSYGQTSSAYGNDQKY